MRLSAMRARSAPGARARELGPAAAGFVLMLGAAVAGAAWISGSLFDLREAVARGVDLAAAHAGFRLRSVEIEGVGGARSQEVRALAAAADRVSLLSADPFALKARIEALHWVRSAEVTRLWPSTLRVRVQRREAFAVVQRDGVAAVVDRQGRPAPDATLEDYQRLPLLVGAGALSHSEDVLSALDEAPAVRERTHALIRVSDRRWDLELRNGMRILLPEREAPRALARIEGLHRLHGLLDRPLERLDMRHAGELVVLPGQSRPMGVRTAQQQARLFAKEA